MTNKRKARKPRPEAPPPPATLGERFDRLGFAAKLGIAATSGFIVSCGAPPDGWLVASFVGWVPLLAVVSRSQAGVREVFLFGFVGGLGVGLGGFPWISEMLVKFAHVPWPVGWIGVFFFSAWMALPYGLFALALRYGPRVGALGFAFVVATYVALQAGWPVIFPYTVFLGFAERPALLQLAEWVGVHGIEAVVLGAQVCLVRALFAPARLSRVGYLGAWALTPLVMIGVGELRMEQVDREVANAPTLRVGIVQPNVGIFRVESHRKLARLTDPTVEAVDRGAEFIVWPEAGTFPYPIGRPFSQYGARAARKVLSGHHKPTLFGAGSREPEQRFGYNSTFLIDGQGDLVGTYDKVNLVPLGEYVPIIDPDWLTQWVGNIAHHHAGEGPARFVLELEGRSVAMAPLICYEDIIAGFVREAAAQEGGVELFVNQTIDAWYGDSAEPWEHLALAQFRAVEHRVPLVRSVSTGVSAIVDANGRLVAHAPLRAVTPETLGQVPPEALVETLRLARNTETHPTFYARIGWFFPHLCQIAVVVGLVFWRRRASE
ncbi:MAG: apolipoprotein N-acyltransferase [bacterium]|nr:apolipoprotein N-acyltransferase [bacterium]